VSIIYLVLVAHSAVTSLTVISMIIALSKTSDKCIHRLIFIDLFLLVLIHSAEALAEITTEKVTETHTRKQLIFLIKHYLWIFLLFNRLDHMMTIHTTKDTKC